MPSLSFSVGHVGVLKALHCMSHTTVCFLCCASSYQPRSWIPVPPHTSLAPGSLCLLIPASLLDPCASSYQPRSWIPVPPHTSLAPGSLCLLIPASLLDPCASSYQPLSWIPTAFRSFFTRSLHLLLGPPWNMFEE